jgi:hypothetical protein
MAQILTLLTCVQQVTGSNLGRQTDYPDWFSSVPATKRQNRLLSNPLQFMTHYSSFYFDAMWFPGPDSVVM